MIDSVTSKKEKLFRILNSYNHLAVAFSGGVDSTYLAQAAFDVLGKKAIAITVDSEAYPEESIIQSRELAKFIGIRLIEIKADVTEIPQFCENPPDRCYHCKKALFNLMLTKAHDEGIDIIADGTNIDDDDDYRPGHRALQELKVMSPLKEAAMTKDDIRLLSKDAGLATWNHQSFACLASRFPYGDTITTSLLKRTADAELLLKDLGLKRYRVRNHGDIARIELDDDGFGIIMQENVKNRISSHLKSLGYSYVTIDLDGYRTGSMNETLENIQ